MKRFSGTSARISCAKSIAKTQTDVTLAAYRYSTTGNSRPSQLIEI
ncbi:MULTISPECIES: fimbria/pilus outer membrane usher protein [unclassified Burkholderia]|nr:MULTISPECIES: fimbria/pilus outer membrane usher protein [unclassified Burkholderia]